MPGITPWKTFPEIGGLMSYGTNSTEMFQRAAVYVDQCLKRAKPGDLPVVQSSRFELVVNAEAARLLGLTVPASLLSTADEVIE